MNWKQSLFSASLIMVTSLMIVACGKENKSNEQINPYNAYGCPTGGYYSGGYCYDANGQVLGYQNGIMGGISINLVGDNYQYRNIRITNGSVYQNFLRKALHVCDQATGLNGGTPAGCSSWLSGYAQLVIQAPSTQTSNIRMIFSAYPRVNQYFNYSYQFPSAKDFFLGLVGLPPMDNWKTYGATTNPLSLDLVVSAINKSKGFEARGYGDMYTQANRSLIQFMATNAKLEDQQIDFQLAFDGQIFASGRLIRY